MNASKEDVFSALRPVPRQRLYEQVAERVLSHIVQAGLHDGDRLPPERELAMRLAVSRTSVRQAIAVLEAQGILEVRHGDGTLLRRIDHDSVPFAKLLDRRERLPEVLEAREALEVKTAELAAKRRTDRDLAALDEALANMEAEVDSGNIGASGDKEFHRAVAVASHNRYLSQLLELMGREIEETRVESLSQPLRPPQSLASHRRIAEAIRAGHPQEAANEMRKHLVLVGNTALRQWDPEDADESA